jgi:hypothetical protein
LALGKARDQELEVSEALELGGREGGDAFYLGRACRLIGVTWLSVGMSRGDVIDLREGVGGAPRKVSYCGRRCFLRVLGAEYGTWWWWRATIGPKQTQSLISFLE